MDISLELLLKILLCTISVFIGLSVLLQGLSYFMDLKLECRFLNDREDDKK